MSDHSKAEEWDVWLVGDAEAPSVTLLASSASNALERARQYMAIRGISGAEPLYARKKESTDGR